MSRFCTNCGTSLSDGSVFCTSCGARNEPTTSTGSSVEVPQESADAVALSPDGGIPVTPSGRSFTKSRVFKVLALVVVFAGVTGGSFAIGKSSVDQEKIRKSGYDSGFTEGRDSGYDSGYSTGESTGYTAGKRDGCEWVFDQANSADYVTKYDVYGYGFSRFPGNVYVSKSNC